MTSKREFITDKWFNSSVPSGSGISTAKGFDVSIALVSVFGGGRRFCFFTVWLVLAHGPSSSTFVRGFFFVHELIHNSFLSDEAG